MDGRDMAIINLQEYFGMKITNHKIVNLRSFEIKCKGRTKLENKFNKQPFMIAFWFIARIYVN